MIFAHHVKNQPRLMQPIPWSCVNLHEAIDQKDVQYTVLPREQKMIEE